MSPDERSGERLLLDPVAGIEQEPGASGWSGERPSRRFEWHAMLWSRRTPELSTGGGSAAERAGSYELAYQEGKRALEEQERAVGELRSRAGQLIAAAAIATSFFGGRAIGSHVQTAAWVAIACFVGLSLAVLAILWPRRDWEFALSPTKLIASYIEPADEDPVALSGIHRDLALHMDASAERNREQLRWLFIAFRVGAVLLVGEVVAWVTALTHHA